MKKQIAWIFGGAALVGLGMVGSLNACSGGSPEGNDSGTGKDATTDTGTNKDSGTGNDGSSNDGSGNDGSTQDSGCKTPKGPFTTDAGPFCPFQDDGGVFAACNTGEHCCVYSQSAKLPSTCNPGGGPCTTGADAGTADFQCNESNDCPGQDVCCLNTPGEVQSPTNCSGYDIVSKNRGTTCKPSCGAGEAQICGSDNDCTGGKKCYATSTLAIWLGVCVSADGGI